MPLDSGAAAPSDSAPAGETRVELKTPITNESSAAAALEGLLDFGDAGSEAGADNTESDAAASDAGPQETAATGDEEGQSEAPADTPAPIEPPKSWSAGDQAAFAKLPPEAQAVIARRESERDAAFTKRTQEIADERKGWEAERAAVQTQRQQYLTNLQQLFQVALPEAKALEGVDWAKLAAENAPEYVRLSGLRDQLRGRLGAIQGEVQRVQQQAKAESDMRLQSLLADERAKLIERVPDFADPAKAQKLTADLGGYLQKSFGFTADEVAQAADHRIVSLAIRAMRADQAEEARKAAEAKRVNPTPPNVQRPGSPQAAGDAGARRAQEKVRQLGRTNSVRDAASLLADFL